MISESGATSSSGTQTSAGDTSGHDTSAADTSGENTSGESTSSDGATTTTTTTTDTSADVDWGSAQVSTIQLSEQRYLEGLYMDPDGALFGAPGWTGKDVLRITDDGVVSVFSTGHDGPYDITRGDDGRYYVSSFNDNTLRRVNSQGGAMTVVGEELDGPKGTVTSADGTVYVTGWGGWGSNEDGETLYRLDNGDETVVHAMGEGLSSPHGLAADGQGNLYVSNGRDARVHRVDPQGEVTLLAQLPTGDDDFNLAQMVFAGDRLIAAGGRTNVIYEIALNGDFKAWGSGDSEDVDGALESASFHTPIGLAVSPDGKTLWVSTASEKLRVVSVE